MAAPPLDSPCDGPVTYPGDTKILVKSSKGRSGPTLNNYDIINQNVEVIVTAKSVTSQWLRFFESMCVCGEMATFCSRAWSWRLQRAVRKSNGLLVQFAMGVCKVASYNDPHYQYHELRSFHFLFMSDFCYWFHSSFYTAYLCG